MTALAPKHFTSSATHAYPWRRDLDFADFLHNGWLVNGYVSCTILNNGTEVAKDATQALQLGNVRSEISRTIEVSRSRQARPNEGYSPGICGIMF
jgi:hypothetical protein